MDFGDDECTTNSARFLVCCRVGIKRIRNMIIMVGGVDIVVYEDNNGD